MPNRLYGLRFIYLGLGPSPAWAFGRRTSCPPLGPALLAAADRYSIRRLKLMCEDRLCSHIDTGSVATILALAEKHRCAILKKVCLEFLGSATLFAAMGLPHYHQELICNVIARNQEKGKTVGWNNQQSN
jgi:hypothetical protein